MSKNAEGWIRHRGGKCPVEVGTLIDIRCRDGLVREGVPCGKDFTRTASMFWIHEGDGAEVMAYRLHKPAEQAVNMEALSDCVNALGDSHADVMESVLSRLDGPLQWRDRIAEIDSTTQALTTERAELVHKLASDGFALIGRFAEPVEDMSDWRNWKKGDLIEMVNQKSWVDMTGGKTYALTKAGSQGFSFVDDIGDMREAFERTANDYAKDFKWHSRPSA